MRYSALKTQDSKVAPWRSEAEHAISRSRRFLTIFNHHEWVGKKHFVSLKLECQSGVRTHDLRLSKQAASTTAPGPPTSNKKKPQTELGQIFHTNLRVYWLMLHGQWCRKQPTSQAVSGM